MAFYKIFKKFKINYNTRSNVWGHLNLKTKLTKKKWKNTFLYSNLHKFAYKKKRKNKFKKHLPPLKYVYKNNLHEKQKLRFFYGKILDFQLKKIYNKTKRNNMFFLTEEFIKNIESRLDLVLYRSHFFKTIFELKESIKNNRVSVNNKTIAYNNYLLKPGDLITINGSKLYKKNIYKKRIRNMSLLIRVNIMLPKLAYSPEHLELNLKTLSIIFLHKPYFKTLYFPTNINFFNLLRKFK